MKKILVIDDNAANLSIIHGILCTLYKVYPVDSGAAALKFLKKQRPDLILLDVVMPEMSGIRLMEILKSDPYLAKIPVIFLTVTHDIENEARAFELGAVDYIRKPVDSIILRARVKQHLELEYYRQELQETVEARTEQVRLLLNVTLDLLARATESRDKYVENHDKRTSEYACAIMDNLTMDLPTSYHITNAFYDDVKKSLPLHDLGKTAIPDSILLKPGNLTDEEFEVIKTHVPNGTALLSKSIKEFDGPSFLDVALEIVSTHHEKWNGTGYPEGLAQEEIPLSGRITALVDVYDALTTKRPYRPALSHQEALKIIQDESGKHFDPVLVDIFVKIQDKIQKIAAQYPGDE